MLAIDQTFWSGKRVLMTGHTGFKGSWLTLWLQTLGAQVFGISKRNENESSLYPYLGLVADQESFFDICDNEALNKVFATFQPEIVFHLAAESILADARSAPLDTIKTNVVGTANILEAVRTAGLNATVLLATTDKVYLNEGKGREFSELDPLGGHEIYGASKAAAEHVISAYQHDYFRDHTKSIISVRAGNIFGGGDSNTSRLIPDLIEHFASGATCHIKHPGATRPWQHVLDAVCGYLLLAQLADTCGSEHTGAWNIGPEHDSHSVSWIADIVAGYWGEDATWSASGEDQTLVEAAMLSLNCQKFKSATGWSPQLAVEQGIALTLAWEKAYREDADMLSLSLEQLKQYNELNAHDET